MSEGFVRCPDSVARPATPPWPFLDSECSLGQIGSGPTRLEADFARCLAVAAWASNKPMRMVALGLPMHAALDDCLLACLRNAGWTLDGLDDARLARCWDSRWEFVAPTASVAAHYRPGPSYHERLRVELLLDAWERASLQGSHTSCGLDALTRALANATAAFCADLALPFERLRDAAAERRAEIDAEQRLRTDVRDRLDEIASDDIRHLAIAGALDGWADLGKIVQRYGTESMRARVAQWRLRPPSTRARAELEPSLERLRRELWSPFAPVSR